MATGPSRRKSSVRCICRRLRVSGQQSSLSLQSDTGGCCVFALWSFLSLSLSFGRLSSFLVFDRARGSRRRRRGTRRREDERRERERERSLVVVVILVALLALLNAISMHTKNWGRKNVEHKTRVLINTGTNDDVRFLSPFTKFSLLRIEANGRRETESSFVRSHARSFVRVTRVCDTTKNILLDGRLTRQKM